MQVVTGAFGYIGRYITRRLLEAGETLKKFDFKGVEKEKRPGGRLYYYLVNLFFALGEPP